MPIDPRTIRSHTFAPEGPTADTVKLTSRAAEQTGQLQALHHHQHGEACAVGCLVFHPNGHAEQLVPAVPSAPVPLHAPVLADDLVVTPLDSTGQVSGPAVVFPGGTVAQDPTNWPDAGDVLDPGGYSADPPSHHAELLEDPEGNAAAGQFPSAGVNGGPS